MIVGVKHLVKLGLKRLGGLYPLGVAGLVSFMDQFLQRGRPPGGLRWEIRLSLDQTAQAPTPCSSAMC